jgi:hypothetical protein
MSSRLQVKRALLRRGATVASFTQQGGDAVGICNQDLYLLATPV